MLQGRARGALVSRAHVLVAGKDAAENAAAPPPPRFVHVPSCPTRTAALQPVKPACACLLAAAPHAPPDPIRMRLPNASELWLACGPSEKPAVMDRRRAAPAVSPPPPPPPGASVLEKDPLSARSLRPSSRNGSAAALTPAKLHLFHLRTARSSRAPACVMTGVDVTRAGRAGERGQSSRPRHARCGAVVRAHTGRDEMAGEAYHPMHVRLAHNRCLPAACTCDVISTRTALTAAACAGRSRSGRRLPGRRSPLPGRTRCHGSPHGPSGHAGRCRRGCLHVRSASAQHMTCTHGLPRCPDGWHASDYAATGRLGCPR